MKLRNKKTGEIGSLISGVNMDDYQIAADDYTLLGKYETLAKLNEDWEDYKPAEPLIKDEKIRKAVRAWAGAVGKSDTLIEFDESANSLWCNQSRIQFDKDEFKSLKNWYTYTIAELCGEEGGE